jgi:hypothetical protein
MGIVIPAMANISTATTIPHFFKLKRNMISSPLLSVVLDRRDLAPASNVFWKHNTGRDGKMDFRVRHQRAETTMIYTHVLNRGSK